MSTTRAFLISAAVLLLPACVKAADDLTTVAAWTWSAAVQNRQPVGRLTSARQGQPLYLWVRFEGGRAALEYLQKQGKLPIVAQWFWYPLDTPIADTAGEFIDPVNLSVGRKDKLRSLEQELGARGWFDWTTWTVKHNTAAGYWNVRLVYSDNTLVRCQNGVPCKFSIQVR